MQTLPLPRARCNTPDQVIDYLQRKHMPLYEGICVLIPYHRREAFHFYVLGIDFRLSVQARLRYRCQA